MNTSNAVYSAGWVALATAITTVLATVLIFLFYAAGGPFGTFNDIFNGVAGILSGVLAWTLTSQFGINFSLQSRASLVLAVIGAIVVLIGSILIIFDVTGWVLAGWYTTVGNALIGMWLLMFNDSMRRSNMLPRRLVTFGLFVGAIMAVGIIAIPGILRGIDSADLTPGYLNLAYLGYVGTYFLYPAWTIWLGRTLLSR
jgi:uncharacterized membrane protein YeaQ/YmgE (transglycosylase-associated protein family)